jgi:transcriptional regulator with XRE-family HTH domain
MTLGQRIKAARKHAGLSAAALAKVVSELSGISCTQQQISNLERGLSKSGRSAYVYWIAKATEVRVEWLHEGAGPMLRNEQERQLLQLFRAIPVAKRDHLLTVTATFIEGSQQKLLPAPADEVTDPVNLVDLESRRR